MKNLKVAKTKLINGFGVALMKGEQIINHFDHFKEHDADNTTKFISNVIKHSREIVKNDVPRVIQIADGGYYVTMSAENEEGAEIFFSSRAFKHGDTAARCGAICFLVLKSLKDKKVVNDYDSPL